MKSPKDKANDLFKQFYNININRLYNMTKEQAKQCALVCVDEIIEAYENMANVEYENFPFVKYCEEVKKEIKNL